MSLSYPLLNLEHFHRWNRCPSSLSGWEPAGTACPWPQCGNPGNRQGRRRTTKVDTDIHGVSCWENMEHVWWTFQISVLFCLSSVEDKEKTWWVDQETKGLDRSIPLGIKLAPTKSTNQSVYLDPRGLRMVVIILETLYIYIIYIAFGCHIFWLQFYCTCQGILGLQLSEHVRARNVGKSFAGIVGTIDP